MSGKFGDINAEPKPGTALRNMIEEQYYLDEFMAMIKAKLELDEKHLRELRALRDSWLPYAIRSERNPDESHYRSQSWNPNWIRSGIKPLVSPLLAHLDNEITQRENAMAELTARFVALPETRPPNSLDEDGLYPLETLHAVETRYHQYKKTHNAIIAPESINEIKKWQNQVAPGPLFDGRVLPVSKRNYRKAVVAQQETVERAIKWTADNLAGVLESHQQRTEDVKSFLELLLIPYSNLHAGLSTSCSAAIQGNRAFSSSRFIAPRHDEREKDASHALLQMVQYRNYMLDGQVARPIFGLGFEKTVRLLNQLRAHGRYDVTEVLSELNWTTRAFKLEEEAVTKELPALLNSQTTRVKNETLAWVIFMDTPLLPLDRFDLTRYPKGVPRKALPALLNFYLPQPQRRTEVLKLLMWPVDSGKVMYGADFEYNHVGFKMCHHMGGPAGQLVQSIWRKWEIEEDRTFPEGVERVWSEVAKRSEVVWKKSGERYYIL